MPRPKYVYSDSDEEWLDVVAPRKKKQTKAKPSKPKIPFLVPNVQLPLLPKPPENFQDLYNLAKVCVELGHMYKDCQRLPEIWEVLREIHGLIGLEHVKDTLASMLMYEMLYVVKPKNPHWKHIVITGPPGTGKTTIAKIIGKALAILHNRNSIEITIGNQRNLISDWHGQTKSCVDEVVKEAVKKSGVLFIDEAPNLNDGREGSMPDSYAKSAIDTIMELMDVYMDDLVVIFGGYEEEMHQNVISANKGLERRIQWWFKMQAYSASELHEIFLREVEAIKYELTQPCVVNVQWFQERYDFFPWFGGSVKNFLEKIRVVQNNATFGQAEGVKRNVSNDTLVKAFQMFQDFGVD